VSRYDLTEDINFIILASDGMWDVIRDQEAGDIARKILATRGVLSEGKCTSTDKKAIEAACTAASQELLDTSMHRGSSDNVTVVVAMYLH
jgi:serine/threonine protein phosphatase PrpC